MSFQRLEKNLVQGTTCENGRGKPKRALAALYWCGVLGLVLASSGCKWPAFMSKDFSPEERKGKVVVEWLDGGVVTKPKLLVPLKKATVTSAGKALRLNFKSAGDVGFWTYTQMVEVDLSREGKSIKGFASQAGDFQFYYLNRDGRPQVAVYNIAVDKSEVSGSVGGSVNLSLNLTKSRATTADGKRYSPQLPKNLLLSGELRPEWK